jgi:CheY-like chemotaxis protein
MPRVLIVDDNATNLTLFRHLLKKLDDIHSECFADPIEAIEWCKMNEPDLVLLDYMMPMMNGLEFIQQFRAMDGYKDIPLDYGHGRYGK